MVVAFSVPAFTALLKLNMLKVNYNPQLAVSNVGPRLPAEMHGRLFDSMVSVRNGPRDAEPHLGLGLYIARLCAQFHGATVHADDRADGRGVIVSVVFPFTGAAA